MRSLATVLFVTLLMQGCTMLSLRLLDDPPGKIEQALDEQDYNRAWQIVSAMPTGHPQYQATIEEREKVEQAIDAFERRSIAEARNLADNGDWFSAIALLDKAQRQWSHGDALREARQELDRRQMVPLMTLRGELLISEADWLAGRREQRRQLQRFADPSARHTGNRLAVRQLELADELELLGNWFASRESWQQAHATLAAARKLVPERSLPNLDQAMNQVAGAERRARDARSVRLRRQAREHLEAYRQSRELADLLAVGDFVEGRREDLRPEYAEFELLREERYNRDLQRGDVLYAKGEYRAAYDIWQALLPLAPDNRDLVGRLERTRRVLHSLQQLEADNGPRVSE